MYLALVNMVWVRDKETTDCLRLCNLVTRHKLVYAKAFLRSFVEPGRWHSHVRCIRAGSNEFGWSDHRTSTFVNTIKITLACLSVCQNWPKASKSQGTQIAGHLHDHVRMTASIMCSPHQPHISFGHSFSTFSIRCSTHSFVFVNDVQLNTFGQLRDASIFFE